MKKLSIWGVGKLAMKAGLLITLVFVSINIGSLYIDFKDDNPDSTILEFITNEKEEEYAFYAGPSEDFIETVRLYNNTSRSVWFALFFFAMFEIFAFKEEPNGHWFRWVKSKVVKAASKMEDD